MPCCVFLFRCDYSVNNFLSAILVSLGLAVYPLGWSNREMQESCGNSSQAYKLGKLSNYFETSFPCGRTFHQQKLTAREILKQIDLLIKSTIHIMSISVLHCIHIHNIIEPVQCSYTCSLQGLVALMLIDHRINSLGGFP